MKKYIIPAIEIVKVRTESLLGNASIGVADPSYHGDTSDALSKGNILWDFDDDEDEI